MTSLNWGLFGISPNQFPQCNPCRGKVVIAGGARCVWEDLRQIGGDFDLITVNDVTMHVPFYVKHAYSNDHIMLPHWINARRPRLNRGIQAHTCQCGDMKVWPWPGHGSSSLNAVYTALALGYDEIILAGIPLDNSGHYFDPPGS